MAIANQKTAIEHIRLSEIHADYRWNARKATIRDEADGVVGRPIIVVGTGGTDDPSRGRDGLVASIAEHGQDTPCIVRKAPKDAKHKRPYELVAGFRRHDARMQVAEDKGEKEPTLKCEIRVLSDREAREMNVRENTERDGLGAGDLCYAVASICDSIKLSGAVPSDAELSDSLGISVGYANIMHRIWEGVSPKIIGQWRELSNPGKAFAFLTAMIGTKDKPIAKGSREQTEAFEAYKAGKEPKAKGENATPTRGKDGWMAKCEEEARRLGLAFGRMSRDAHLTMHGEDFFRANVRALLKMPEKATDEQCDVMILALEKGAEEGEQSSQSEADKKACEVNGLVPKAPKAPASAPAAKGKTKGKVKRAATTN